MFQEFATGVLSSQTKVRGVRVKENFKRDLLQLLLLCTNTSCLAQGLGKLTEALLNLCVFLYSIYILYAKNSPDQGF